MLTLAGPALLGACGPGIPPLGAAQSTAEGEALLRRSSAAHGADAFARLRDVSVRYAGQWRPIVGALQPALVDSGHRGESEERLLPHLGLVAQAYTGPAGRKQVVRQDASGGRGRVRVWFDGAESGDREQRDAAALVADGYALFLFGPMLLDGPWRRERRLVLAEAGRETISPWGKEVECDVLRASLHPGLGLSDGDELMLFTGRGDGLMHRVRFTLNGLEATQGAVAEVDCGEHLAYRGLRWPTRFHEQLLRPGYLPVHDWRLLGLDVDRGFGPSDIDGPAFRGAASAPAGRPLTPAPAAPLASAPAAPPP